MQNILIINAGSSSLKYQLINMDNEESIAKGVCERIGFEQSIFKYENNKGISKELTPKFDTHEEAIQTTLQYLTDKKIGVIASIDEILAVGHRFSHGGEGIKKCSIINDETIAIIEENIELAPLHNPPALTGIKACQKVMKEIPMTAMPDTGFTTTIPMEAAVYPIPYEFYEKFKIKKYGFHGMSHQYVSEKAAEIVGKPYNEINTITCHLGNGSSITAVNKGVAVENSMGFTPLAGVTMGTRSGSIDPAIILYLIENKGYTSKEVGEILNKKSGLLGVSGISSDLRDLWSEAEKGNERAKLALDIFAYRVKKCIGEYAAVLGGIDVLVFTAGIGENDVATRAKIIEGLEFMGVEIDNEKNKKGKKVVDISKDGSKVKTLVIQTNEEIVIARETLKRINGQ